MKRVLRFHQLLVCDFERAVLRERERERILVSDFSRQERVKERAKRKHRRALERNARRENDREFEQHDVVVSVGVDVGVYSKIVATHDG